MCLYTGHMNGNPAARMARDNSEDRTMAHFNKRHYEAIALIMLVAVEGD